MTTVIITRTATDIGSRTHQCDYAAEHISNGTTAVAVIDGIGSSSEIARAAEIAGEVAVRVGVRKGPLAGLLAAHDTLASGVESGAVDAVGALAVVYPDNAVGVVHVGDCRAYSWDGTTLTRHTVDHTFGEMLRAADVPDVTARSYDHIVRTTLGRASVGSITPVTIKAPLVLITSDGVHKVMTDEEIALVVAEHETDPRLADHIVDAARDLADGERDNMTVAVLRIVDVGRR